MSLCLKENTWQAEPCWSAPPAAQHGAWPHAGPNGPGSWVTLLGEGSTATHWPSCDPLLWDRQLAIGKGGRREGGKVGRLD